MQKSSRPTSGTAEKVNMSMAPFSSVTSSSASHSVASYDRERVTYINAVSSLIERVTSMLCPVTEICYFTFIGLRGQYSLSISLFFICLFLICLFLPSLVRRAVNLSVHYLSVLNLSVLTYLHWLEGPVLAILVPRYLTAVGVLLSSRQFAQQPE